MIGLKPSDFAIVNTDNPADFDVEKQLRLSDKDGRKLDLRLHYLYADNHELTSCGNLI
jgi:vacuolar protein sorting-associated protein 13A/C